MLAGSDGKTSYVLKLNFVFILCLIFLLFFDYFNEFSHCILLYCIFIIFYCGECILIFYLCTFSLYLLTAISAKNSIIAMMANGHCNWSSQFSAFLILLSRIL